VGSVAGAGVGAPNSRRSATLQAVSTAHPPPGARPGSAPAGSALGGFVQDLVDGLRPQRPPAATAASRALRALILATAIATVLVDLANLHYAAEAGWALGVRTVWALARAIGFLFLMRAVRFGRMSAKPFGLILAATTVFAVFRLAQPKSGRLLPPIPVLIGMVVLTALCAAIVWLLYRSDAVHEHLSARQARRHLDPWALTARVAALAFSALLIVPFLVAISAVYHHRAGVLGPPLLTVWGALCLVVTFVVPLSSLFVLYAKGWARWIIGLLSAFLMVVQPVLCYLVLGIDGLIRDGVPMVVATAVALHALYRSRGRPSGYRLPRQG
jgi:hypothetical protein